MTPRNPEDRSTADLQNRSLQDKHDAPHDPTHAPADSEPRATPPAASLQGEDADAKIVLDRLEAYMKGPTVFSA
ncbi:hypothetical protein [Microvirga pakistanensis]|uniref:hypothetical protein n=1 Tax=Microvirga pakistanensis TaxID=1682650 RepID=UPI00106B7D25|nr:hypothetical protein [Microvirga pakistanensis]